MLYKLNLDASTPDSLGTCCVRSKIHGVGLACDIGPCVLSIYILVLSMHYHHQHPP